MTHSPWKLMCSRRSTSRPGCLQISCLTHIYDTIYTHFWNSQFQIHIYDWMPFFFKKKNQAGTIHFFGILFCFTDGLAPCFPWVCPIIYVDVYKTLSIDYTDGSFRFFPPFLQLTWSL